MKNGKLILINVLLSIGFALLFYGSSINFQWEYLRWNIFFETWIFFAITMVVSSIVVIWYSKRSKSESK